MPSYRTDDSGFPVLTSLDGTDPVQHTEQFDLKLPEGTTAAQARAEQERRGKRWPSPSAARGVAGFGAGASNSSPAGAA